MAFLTSAREHGAIAFSRRANSETEICSPTVLAPLFELFTCGCPALPPPPHSIWPGRTQRFPVTHVTCRDAFSPWLYVRVCARIGGIGKHVTMRHSRHSSWLGRST